MSNSAASQEATHHTLRVLHKWNKFSLVLINGLTEEFDGSLTLISILVLRPLANAPQVLAVAREFGLLNDSLRVNVKLL